MRKAKRKAIYKLCKDMNTATEWRLVTGSAGFIKLYKDGERIQYVNFTMRWRT